MARTKVRSNTRPRDATENGRAGRYTAFAVPSMYTSNEKNEGGKFYLCIIYRYLPTELQDSRSHQQAAPPRAVDDKHFVKCLFLLEDALYFSPDAPNVPIV
ncbi:hypothetical protein EVAR_34376_1 [Eumeta japonica]|uniref:Uncharacterized protein n=1 Tax=Eumeta variegata TaxID=151549 RepID=A0A4C1YS68_EUMVA|nr:hypothetical protein EVAR_34376_1 [Eumeta japonica]